MLLLLFSIFFEWLSRRGKLILFLEVPYCLFDSNTKWWKYVEVY